MRRRYAAALIISLLAALASCVAGGEASSSVPEVFGAELYNASFVVDPRDEWPDEEFRHVIPFMSSLNLNQTVAFDIVASGATYEVRMLIEDWEYQYRSHRLHALVLFFSDLEFYEDTFSVSEISVWLGSGEEFTLVPYRAEFVLPEHELSVEGLYFTGSPLEMPYDMAFFPLELTASADVVLREVILTNPSFEFDQYLSDSGLEEDRLLPTELRAGDSLNLFIPFALSESNEFMHYGTSIMVLFERDGISYLARTPVATIYFNAFDPIRGHENNAVERYYSYLQTRG